MRGWLYAGSSHSQWVAACALQERHKISRTKALIVKAQLVRLVV